jgi:signal transduction histidine kinase
MVAELATTLAAGIGARHDAAIDLALAQTGEFVGADRAYLMVFDRAANTSSNTHEWCGPGIEPQREHLQGVPLDVIPWFVERIDQGPILVDDVRAMPTTATVERELLEMQGIRSISIVPVAGTEGMAGFVGFDAVRELRHWVPEEIELLSVLATIIGSMIERERAFQALDDQRRRVHAMLDAIPDLVFSIHEDGRILYAKPSSDLVVPAEDACGRPMRELIDPRLADELLEVVRLALHECGVVKEHGYELDIPGVGRQAFEARFAAHAPDEATAIVRNVTEQKEARRVIEDHRRRLEALARQQAEAEHALRHRIAAEVHDGIAQELAMARLLTAKAADEAERTRTLGLLAEVLDGAVRHVNELTREIDPPTLRSLGLLPALREVGETLARRHGISFSLEERGVPSAEWPRADRALVYWSSRELMVNVVRHARATRLVVRVRWLPVAVSVEVEDDGVGLVGEPTPGFGLFRVREGLRLAGGELTMRPRSPHGLHATLELPWRGT